MKLQLDRGRKDRLSSVPPPSEPGMRISRTRLSGWWFYLQEDDVNGQKTLSGRDLLPATRVCSRDSEHVTDDRSRNGFGCSGLSSLSLRPKLVPQLGNKAS